MLESGIKKGLACCEAKCARFLRATVTVRGNNVQLVAKRPAPARFARGLQRNAELFLLQSVCGGVLANLVGTVVTIVIQALPGGCYVAGLYFVVSE